LDGRGTAFKSANLFQSAFGSRFLISWLILLNLF